MAESPSRYSSIQAIVGDVLKARVPHGVRCGGRGVCLGDLAHVEHISGAALLAQVIGINREVVGGARSGACGGGALRGGGGQAGARPDDRHDGIRRRLKEVGIAMERVPSNRGYMGDLYSQLARRRGSTARLSRAGPVASGR